VALEIDGEELIAAGVPQGPQIGQGLAEALRRKLDGELSGRDEELAVALETARKFG
jgi:tRNA nucleotidyltransferase (CCA-adding enzyme)